MRKEKDILGEKEIPKEAYYGIFTQRAIENFQLSGYRAHPFFISSLAYVKKACALANKELKRLSPDYAEAICTAADEVIEGIYDNHFPLDVFQAGACTPYNMNMNEVIANRATELLGGQKGQYIVHPNNHVNMSQSTNNVVPTAIRIASLFFIDHLVQELKELERVFREKASEYRQVIKVGRTHLQDAVPITYGQVFSSYATICVRSVTRLKKEQEELLEIGVGGTAIGTGITTPPHFREEAVEHLRKVIKKGFFPARDPIQHTWSSEAYTSLSGVIRAIVIDFQKIGNDLRILCSGPRTGLYEIELPPVEPGSSIMPGKINPSIIEAFNMVCFNILGNDHTIAEASEAGQLELNVNTPIIAFSLFSSFELLINAIVMLREEAIEGLRVHENLCAGQIQRNIMIAAALNPYIGYEVASFLVQETVKKRQLLRQTIIEYDIVPKDCLDILLDVSKMTAPQEIDRKLVEKIQQYPGYLKLKEKIGAL